MAERVFPSASYKWNRDHFGPIYIPEKGKTVELTAKTLPLYSRIIKEYEHHELTTEAGNIYIDGKLADRYTFQQNYYWMEMKDGTIINKPIDRFNHSIDAIRYGIYSRYKNRNDFFVI